MDSEAHLSLISWIERTLVLEKVWEKSRARSGRSMEITVNDMTEDDGSGDQDQYLQNIRAGFLIFIDRLKEPTDFFHRPCQKAMRRARLSLRTKILSGLHATSCWDFVAGVATGEGRKVLHTTIVEVKTRRGVLGVGLLFT